MILAVIVVRYLGPADLAAFAIIQAVVVVATRVLGLGVGITVGRARGTAHATDERAAALLAWQLRFLGRNYLAIIVLTVAVMPFLDNPSAIIWTVAILVPAHVASELYHSLLYAGASLASNVVVALVNGLWAIPAIVICIFLPAARSLDLVLGCWLVGSTAGAALALWCTGAWRALGCPAKAPTLALAQLLPGFVCQLMQFLLLYLDRLIAARLVPADQLGLYVLHWSIGYGTQTLVFSMVATQLAQSLHTSHVAGEHETYRRNMRRGLALTVGVATAALAGMLTVWQLVGPILVGADAVLSWWLALLIFVTFGVRAVIDFLHLALLSASRDRQLALAYLITLPLAIAATAIAASTGELPALVVGVLVAALVTLAALAWAASGAMARPGRVA